MPENENHDGSFQARPGSLRWFDAALFSRTNDFLRGSVSSARAVKWRG